MRAKLAILSALRVAPEPFPSGSFGLVFRARLVLAAKGNFILLE